MTEIYDSFEPQKDADTSGPLTVAIVSHDFYKTNAIIDAINADEGNLSAYGIYRAYHADDIFQKPEQHPKIVVGNGMVKDLPEYLPDDPAVVAYPTKQKAKEAGIPYVRERRSVERTHRAIKRAAKKIQGAQ